MTLKQVEDLHYGDEVRWTDPDDDTCSRTITISNIRVNGEIVCIIDDDGNYLECFADELS